MNGNQDDDDERVKVCVIGAGFAGLSVAYHLLKHNEEVKSGQASTIGAPMFEIELLEARNRIGGRVYPCNLAGPSSSEPPIMVDLGAQWLHEAGPDNPMVQLLQELDIPLLYAKNEATKPTDQSPPREGKARRRVASGTYTADGVKIPDEIFNAARHFFNKAKNNYKRTKINVNTSCQDLLAHAFSKIAKVEEEEEAKRGEDEGYATAQSEAESDDSSSSSSSEEDDDDEDGAVTTDDETDDDDSSTDSEDSEALPDHIVSNPLFEQTVNYLVHSTECYEGGRYHELSVSLSGLYQEYEGGDEIPVGGYHAVLTKLEEFIVQQHKEACTLHYNCPVQDIHYEPLDDPSGGNNNDDDNNNHDDPVSRGVKIDYTNETTSQSTSLQADYCVCTVPLGVLQRDIGFHPTLPLAQEQSMDMIGMGVLDKVMILFPTKFWDDDWIAGVAPEDPTRIQTFQDCSEDYNGHPILASLLGGNVARRFDDEDEGLTDQEVLHEVLTTLRTLFGHDVVPDPIHFQVSRWLSDPYSYGAYSFIKVGSTPEDYDRVAKPAGKNLFFAGEHTNKYHHSTVHGAWETGHREAVRLIFNARSDASSNTMPPIL